MIKLKQSTISQVYIILNADRTYFKGFKQIDDAMWLLDGSEVRLRNSLLNWLRNA